MDINLKLQDLPFHGRLYYYFPFLLSRLYITYSNLSSNVDRSYFKGVYVNDLCRYSDS